MAKIADNFVEDRDLAIEYYTKVVTLAPYSGKAYEAQLALKRLGAPVPRLELFNKSVAKPIGAESDDMEKAISYE